MSFHFFLIFHILKFLPNCQNIKLQIIVACLDNKQCRMCEATWTHVCESLTTQVDLIGLNNQCSPKLGIEIFIGDRLNDNRYEVIISSALILAVAGVVRMGWEGRLSEVILKWFFQQFFGKHWNSATVPKRMNLRKSSKGGRGSLCNPKTYIADVGPLHRALKRAFQKKLTIWFFKNEGGG